MSVQPPSRLASARRHRLKGAEDTQGDAGDCEAGEAEPRRRPAAVGVGGVGGGVEVEGDEGGRDVDEEGAAGAAADGGERVERDAGEGGGGDEGDGGGDGGARERGGGRRAGSSAMARRKGRSSSGNSKRTHNTKPTRAVIASGSDDA